MQVKSIAECSVEHSAQLLAFIKLQIVIKIFVLSIYEWPFYTGFTDCRNKYLAVKSDIMLRCRSKAFMQLIHPKSE